MVDQIDTTWLDTISKEQLISITQELGIEQTGTTREIRKRIAALASKANTDSEIHEKCLSLQATYKETTHMSDVNEVKTPTPSNGGGTPKVAVTTVEQTQFAFPPRSTVPTQQYLPSGIAVPPNGTSQAPPRSTVPTQQHVPSEITASSTGTSQPTQPCLPAGMTAPAMNYTCQVTQAPTVVFAPIIDQVRKWSVKYEGERDPLAFIERLEELTEVYALNVDLLPKAMPELGGAALQWYRNNNAHWGEWTSFKKDFLRFFLPVRYFERLEDDIRQRRQHNQEKYKDYVLGIQSLMRHAGYTSE
ncbi:uncharacterized protein [Eurosta solidaginis]|uniref:uncharacterized protein n=1 Tax=Eurosta solidaginis TaxID=178769 RepID=UPI0035315B5E